jgi:2-hydroxyacyl-CoA lyase 1
VPGYRVLARGLAAHGFTHVMGLTGTPINDLLPACGAAGVRPIGVRSQMAGAHMAAALNYMAGKLVAAVAMSAGPAIANAACGVYTAKANGWPLLVIGGGRSNGTQGTGEFQDMDSARFYESITKYSALVESVDRLPFHLGRALTAATTGRPGPVYLDVPEGVLYEKTAPSEVPSWDPTRRAPVAADAVAIAQAAERLNAAERPIVLIDSDLRWDCDWHALRRLVERLGAPFVTTSMARGFVPQTHPLCADALATRAMREADCALLLGARLDWQFRYGVELPAGIPIIQACLEGADVGMRRPSAVALVAPPSRVVAELLPLIADRAATRQKWTDELARRRRDVEAAQARDHAAAVGVTPDTLVMTLRQSLPADALVIADGSACYGAVQRLIPAASPLARLTPGRDGVIGIGLPFAMGARLHDPKRPIVVVSGDAAIGLCLMEFETAVRQNMPVVVVVCNNSSPSAGTSHRKCYPPDYPERVARFSDGVRYDLMAQAAGAVGIHVTSLDAIAPAVEQALASGRPACINVVTEPFTPVRQRT